jgi:hypothetical protein
MAEHCDCGAPIFWAMSPAGAKSPIDAYVNTEKGNVLLLAPTGMGQLLAITLSKDALKLARERRLPLRLSHWATCANREQHAAKRDAKKAAAKS